ncbi:Ankyrin-2 [Xylographa bjoerkii]|nr:Ankyrin-2 [Xylographa bjoerkii]
MSPNASPTTDVIRSSVCLVKRAVQAIEDDMQKSNDIIAKYFFNARGVQLEKSYLGLLRSLVHQILTVSRVMLAELLPRYRKKKIMQGHQVDWHVEDLRNFLLSTLSVQEQSIDLFVDALDECEVHERQDVISFLEQLSNLGRSNHLSINILFSSRHFPDIYIEECNEIQPEDCNNNDISEYVQQRLLKISKKQGVFELQQEIVRKSQGVFLWVVLVVDILIKNRHEIITEKRKKLQQVPSELDQLFTSILQGFDMEELQKTAKIVQWILFAEKPLSPKELLTAVAFDTEHPYTSFEAWRNSGDSLEDEEQLEALIRIRSRGMAEVKRYRPDKIAEYWMYNLIGNVDQKISIVQFIHESVRTFFLCGNDKVHEILSPSMSGNFAGRSHNQLARACSNFLSISEILLWASQILAGSDHVIKQAEEEYTHYGGTLLHHIWPSVSSTFQYYAARFLLVHAQYAENKGVQQAYLVDIFRDQALFFQAWVLLHNKLWEEGIDDEQYFHFQGPQANLLYSTSFYNIPSCVSALLLNQPEQYILSSDYGGYLEFPLIAAAVKGNIEVIKLLLDNEADIEIRVRWEWTALHISARGDFPASAQLLLDRGANIEARDCDLETPLHIASGETARLLLSRGANIEAQNKRKQTALHVAAIKPDELMIRLLLDNGADIEARDDQQNTPLQVATKSAREGAVRLLVDRGANIESQNNKKYTALHSAVDGTEESMTRLLLDMGANPEARDDHQNTPLHHATGYRYKNAAVLLDGGANIEAQNVRKQTALHMAVITGSERMVGLPLDRGASIEAQDEEGRKALDTAIEQVALLQARREPPPFIDYTRSIVRMLQERSSPPSRNGLVPVPTVSKPILLPSPRLGDKYC